MSNRADQAATLRVLRGGRPSSEGDGASITPIDGRRRRVVALTGGKGGVGKSMLAVNLAATYAARGARTLAFDGDLGMADLNLLLGLAPSRSLADVLRGVPIEEVVLEAHGVHLLPALNGSYQLANADARARTKLLEALESLGDRYDTLVIDTAAGIGETVTTLAGAAADIVVVATPEPLSMADAYACIKILATRHGVKRLFLAPNAVRSPSEADEVVQRLSALVDRFLGTTVVGLPSVPWDANVAPAAAAGVPLVLHNPDSPASRAIRRLAVRLDSLSEPEDRPGSPRLWSRLRGVVTDPHGGEK